jgi:hypothetical protein
MRASARCGSPPANAGAGHPISAVRIETVSDCRVRAALTASIGCGALCHHVVVASRFIPSIDFQVRRRCDCLYTSRWPVRVLDPMEIGAPQGDVFPRLPLYELFEDGTQSSVGL